MSGEMSTSSSRHLREVLDRRLLRRLAEGHSFERGERYLASGQVLSLVEYRGTLAAKVLGTHLYCVKLSMEQGSLEYQCSCPIGGDGAFCKHCVAVGLAWLQRTAKRADSKRPEKQANTMEDVRGYLRGQDKAALVELILRQAMDDERLRRRLVMQIAAISSKGLDLATYRELIDDALNAYWVEGYDSMGEFGDGMEEIIDCLARLLKEGHSVEVNALTEYALAGLEKVLGFVDDSDGHVGRILSRLQEVQKAALRGDGSGTPRQRR